MRQIRQKTERTTRCLEIVKSQGKDGIDQAALAERLRTSRNNIRAMLKPFEAQGIVVGSKGTHGSRRWTWKGPRDGGE